MPGRWRRSKRSMAQVDVHAHIPSLLPLTTSRKGISNAISCWYCDYKITSFNELIFQFGRRALRTWFSIGIGFSLAALAVVATVLFRETKIIMHIFVNSNVIRGLPISCSSLFGLPSLISSCSFFPAGAGYIIISTLISVAFHEFGHAAAAASEGVKLEYVAVFIALLFPGALVAFNHDALQDSSCFSALRIYCAGIWHNTALSAASGLILFFLPLILFPLYIHGQSPMVLDVPYTSPLSSYLSHGHVILSLDGMHVHSVDDWINLSAEISELTFQNETHSRLGENNLMANGRRGYCFPNFMLKESNKVQFTHDQATCFGDFTSFTSIPCVSSTGLIDGYTEDNNSNRKEGIYCLNVNDVMKLNKCSSWDKAVINDNTSSCMCSRDETCLSPVQMPGLVWVEITYLNPYSSDCFYSREYPLPSSNCSGTFIFVGDVVSMARSIQLTMYRPRFDFHFATYLPDVLEKILSCLFHTSLALALLNSLPVYCLDGESILEILIFQLTSLSPRNKEKVLRSFLIAGTLISIFLLLRIFFHLLIS
ncbi:membrane-bound transcription factor site-2 protease homolog isoform X2 [Cucumis melo]|uniref:Endopeptidase S2P n=1 Tax=Cucumis melo TaxID=3656 RepID=A0A1S3AUN7_CUCME|nr:membrane-bound transcription factor site-2 protease homolog isoform X2 [Cucumis melo]